jgi:hypothetical protein
VKPSACNKIRSARIANSRPISIEAKIVAS